MKIAAVEVYHQDLTYAHGEYVMSGSRAAREQASTLVRVRTDDGLEGWGEACPLGGTYLPSSPGSVRAALRDFGPAVLGLDPRETGVLHDRMQAVLRGFPEARSPIDIACWDILGKAAGLPVATLLGGVRQPDFPLYEAVPLSAPQQMAAFVERRRAAGVTAFQLKVGNRPGDDAARTAAVMEVADGCTVICDANGGWRLQDAVRAVALLADFDVYVEQPCASTEDNAIVRTLTTLPLVLDESVRTPADLYRSKVDAGAGSVNLKLGRLGGITGLRLMRDLAVALGLTVSIEDTWGGDITTAAVAHLAASTDADDMLSTSFFNDWTNEHVADPRPQSVDGRGSASTAPGLGIVVEAAALGEPILSYAL